jgi:cytochrome c
MSYKSDKLFFTKVLAAFSGSLLIFLLSKWGGEILYHEKDKIDENGNVIAGYAIEVEDIIPQETIEEPEIPFSELFAQASASKGERVFNKCKACHQLEDGANGVGPHLYSVVDRNVGVVDGYAYSGSMVKVAEVWSPENLNGFLENPREYAPGTKMSFSGLSKPEDRANLIAYLATIK